MNSLILLHGALGCKSQMQDLADRLSPYYHTYLLDFESHGLKSGNEHKISIPEMAIELETFIKKSKLSKPFVFGYSMGGYVALYHAFLYPDRFEKIMTLATKFDWNPESTLKATKQLDPKLIMEKVPAFAALLEQRHGTEWISLVNKTAELMQGLSRETDLSDIRLAQIDTHCILCLGDQDQMVSQEETHWAASHLKHSTRLILEQTSHPLEKVNLELLTKIISSHLN